MEYAFVTFRPTLEMKSFGIESKIHGYLFLINRAMETQQKRNTNNTVYDM